MVEIFAYVLYVNKKFMCRTELTLHQIASVVLLDKMAEKKAKLLKVFPDDEIDVYFEYRVIA
jgi:hypothetical protein